MAYDSDTNMMGMTYLEAINTLLQSVGEYPISSLEDLEFGEGVMAKSELDRVNREVQSRGWWFNSEGARYVPNIKGEIDLPPNVLSVDDGKGEVINRGKKLYDRKNKTLKFEEPVECEVIIGLTWDELPELVKNYITIRSVRSYSSKVVSSQVLSGFESRDEAEALAMIRAEELRSGNYSMDYRPQANAIRNWW